MTNFNLDNLSEIIDDVLTEFCVTYPIPDFQKEEQLEHLKSILEQFGVDILNVNDLMEAISLSPKKFTLEAPVKKQTVNPKDKVRVDAHKKGLEGKGGKAYGPKGKDLITHRNQNGKLVAVNPPVKIGKAAQQQKKVVKPTTSPVTKATTKTKQPTTPQKVVTPTPKKKQPRATPAQLARLKQLKKAVDAKKDKEKTQTQQPKKVDVNKGVVVAASTGRYGTKGSKDVDQTKANNRLKALPKSGISTETAIANYKKRYGKNAPVTKYDYPKPIQALLKSKLPPAGYDALRSLLKMFKQGKFAPPISDITDQYGAGQVSAQTNELAMQATFAFANTPEGLKQRDIFIKSLLDNEAEIIKAGGTPILDKSWIKHLDGAHDAFIKNMNRQYGIGKWEVTGMTWDVRAQQEALGANYDEKGDSTDINAQVKINGKIQNIEISCKKDWKIFLLNAGLGDASNWYYTLGSKVEARANELAKMKEAEDPRFGKNELNELRELNQRALDKAPVKNTELQQAQMKSAYSGFNSIREIPTKDLNGAIKASLSKGANDYYGIADTDVSAVKLVAKYLATHNKIDPDEFREFMGTNSEKDFKKAVLMYNKVLAEYSGDHKWLDAHRKVTDNFIVDAANKIATNKEFQGMLLRKLQEAIPIKTMVEGVETMQIDSMYVGRDHMKQMFGTDNWDDIKQFLTIKVKDGVASLTYIAKGKTPIKPIKLAEIDLREKGVGYNGSVGLECTPTKEFENACKQADDVLNSRKSK